MALDDQAAVWNESAGAAWVEHARDFDAMLDPFGVAVMDRLDLRADDRVLDVGCGTGSTTVALAMRVSEGTVVGLDLSAPMAAAAAHRLEQRGVSNARVKVADVEQYAFGGDRYDVVFSRFGVMFFPDPLRAFSNLASGLERDGRLGFVCFQDPPSNPFMVVPLFAAAPHLEPAPLPGPTDPGPFSLADPEATAALLRAAGFDDVVIEPGPTEIVLGPADDLVGVAGRVIAQNPTIGAAYLASSPIAQQAAVDATAAALESYRDAGEVRMGAGTWIVRARHAGAE